MRRALSLTAAALAAGGAWADPVLSGVDVSADAGTRLVTAAYTLSEPGIVTFDVRTNGVSIGEHLLTSVFGDVNKRVGSGAHSLYWRPDASALGVDIASADVVLTAWSTSSPPDYMALNMLNWSIRYYTSTNALPGGLDDIAYKTDVLLLRKIPAGGKTFTEGSPTTEGYRTAAQETPREVTFTSDYYIGVFEFTYAQFARIGWKFKWSDLGAVNYSSRSENGDICPINSISFNYMRGSTNGNQWPDVESVDGDSVLGYLRSKSGIDFDLPTDAQWEFACRAGTIGPHYNSTGASANWNVAGQIGWLYYPEANRRTAPQEVGQKTPNAYGLYDMIGNVWELVRGRPYAGTKPGNAITDPKGPSIADGESGKVRRRGAAYSTNDPTYIRSASTYSIGQGNSDTVTGFRVICPAEAVK